MSPRAHHLLEAGRELGQHLVAAAVPERVVDGLEVVEVEQHHGEQPAVPHGAAQRVVDPVEHQRTVRQPGQRVVQGLVLQLALQLVPAYGGPQRRGDGLDERDVVLGPVPGVRAGGADDAPGVLVAGDRAAQRGPHPEPGRRLVVRERRVVDHVVGVDQLVAHQRPAGQRVLVEVEHDGHPVRQRGRHHLGGAAVLGAAQHPRDQPGVAGVDQLHGLAHQLVQRHRQRQPAELGDGALLLRPDGQRALLPDPLAQVALHGGQRQRGAVRGAGDQEGVGGHRDRLAGAEVPQLGLALPGSRARAPPPRSPGTWPCPAR